MRKALMDSFLWRGIYFATTLLLNICIVRIYEASQSGWIYFISNNFYLVLLIGGLSLDSSVTYFSASKQISHSKLALFSLTWPLLVSFFSMLCTGFLIYNNYISSDYIFLLVAGAAYTLGISMTNFFTSLFYARHNFAMPNIYMSIVNICIIILIPFFAKGYWGLNKHQFLYIYFIQFIIQGVGLAFIYLKNCAPIQGLQYPNSDEYKKLFRFAFIALSANIAYYLIYRIDYLFVEAWCSAKSLGNYVQASKMGQFLLIFPSIISSTVYPHSAKENNPKLVKFILQMLNLFCVLYLFIFMVSYFVSHPLFVWIYGGTFDEMYLPFIILIPGILFLSMHTIMAAYFGGKNKPFYNVISTSIGLVVVVIGDLFLIKPFGIAGAAFVSTLGYTTSFCVSLYLFFKITGSGFSDIFSSDTFKLRTYTSFFNSSSSSN